MLDTLMNTRQRAATTKPFAQRRATRWPFFLHNPEAAADGTLQRRLPKSRPDGFPEPKSLRMPPLHTAGYARNSTMTTPSSATPFERLSGVPPHAVFADVSNRPLAGRRPQQSKK
ncbi:hypothetical protein D9619_007700 [Psilocybe cf. subviscida]|uniref:Uncharacterized protein n=1 Tax=Psilocybe cf. subviscida TaxID=2480587 RepID=A0A8H5AV10_9AGAR|nr:hypothetical protein D9619_007700 [Psilocybe cf. subviscida]